MSPLTQGLNYRSACDLPATERERGTVTASLGRRLNGQQNWSYARLA